MSGPVDTPDRTCLRCGAAPLRRLPESTPEMDFLECPSCLRHYASRDGGALTFRWGHPVSLALYGVIFEPQPIDFAPHVAEHLARKRSPQQLAAFAREISLELETPTQVVRDILQSRASEAACRAFLRALVERLGALPGASD